MLIQQKSATSSFSIIFNRISSMSRLLLTCLCLLLLCSMAQDAMAKKKIKGSKHDLSTTGGGAIRAASEREICKFCHSLHVKNWKAPMWNRHSTGNTYEPYWSTTMEPISPVGQPNGTSILCLSCHDGTIALGKVIKRKTMGTEIAMTGARKLSRRSSSLGLELRDDHPISFAYTSELATKRGQDPVTLIGGNELKQPATLPKSLALDSASRVQCTTCHSSHDDSFGMFLAMSDRATDNPYLCTSCHQKESTNEKWSESAHRNSTKPTTGSSDKRLYPYSTIQENGCQNCHTPHGASFSAGATGVTNKSPLLYHAESVNNCNVCHSGKVAEKNIMAETEKFSSHPMAFSEEHDPSPRNEPYQLTDINQHVVCADCHNPHAANAINQSDEPYLPGTLRGVKGISISGNPKKPITRVYELCFRCHGDGTSGAIQYTNRVHEQTNTRDEFQLTNPSYHPVAGQLNTDGNSPSLKGAPATPNYKQGDVITCLDCHNNEDTPTYPFAADRGRGDGSGSGPRGPHGANNTKGNHTAILIRQYETIDNTPESLDNYRLCYYCHNQTSILADESYKGHEQHIRRENTPCNVCHDPHGISQDQATNIGGFPNNTHLINFDTDIVSPDSNNQLRFEDRGFETGACYLTCHGREHSPETY
jgi:predicted CXXCH cytochrome family protein